jgi:hypothetical protein
MDGARPETYAHIRVTQRHEFTKSFQSCRSGTDRFVFWFPMAVMYFGYSNLSTVAAAGN